MGTDLCLEIHKFSYATGTRSDNAIPWQHIYPASTTIFAIVKGNDTHIPDGKLIMNIVHGTTVLETLDVGKYADQANDLRQRCWQTGTSLLTEQLPIAGITRDALFALKYKLQDGQVRRLQVRLPGTSECQGVVRVLERRGVEFQEQRPGTARPGTARPSTTTSQSQAFNTQSNPTSLRPAALTSQARPFALQTMEASSLSAKRHPETERPSTGVQYSAQALRFISRDEALAPREAIAERPSTSHLYRSSTTPLEPKQSQSLGFQHHHPNVQVDKYRSDTDLMAAGREILKNYTSPPVTSSGVPTWSAGQNDSSSPGATRATNDTSPTSTSVVSQVADGVGGFEFGHSRGIQYRPGPIESLSLPPPPKPDAAFGGVGRTYPPPFSPNNKESFGSRPSTASPLKQSFSASASSEPRPQTSGNTGSINQIMSGRALADSNSSQSIGHSSGMGDLSCEYKFSAGHVLKNRMPRLDSLADAPGDVEEESMIPPVSQDRGRASQHQQAITEKHVAPASQGLANRDMRESSLGGYAAQSVQDRQAALEQFMIENLSNPDFTKLCEDVENCWSRFILGL